MKGKRQKQENVPYHTFTTSYAIARCHSFHSFKFHQLAPKETLRTRRLYFLALIKKKEKQKLKEIAQKRTAIQGYQKGRATWMNSID